VRPCSSLLPVEPLEFHGVDPSTVPHVDNNPDWVDAPIPVPTPVFQTPPVADRSPVNNQLAKALWQLLENLNRGSAPKPHQSQARIPDIFDSSDPHKLNHFLFQCQLFFHANCKGTSRVMLSHYWGAVLLVALWQYVYAFSSFLSSLCLCRVVRAFYSNIRTLWLLIHVPMWYCMWSSSVGYIY